MSHHTRIRLLATTLSLSALLQIAPGGDTLTVNDAVRTVLRNHPSIGVAGAQVDVAGARLKQAESAWNPTIGVEAAYTRLAPVATILFGPEELRLFPADNYDAHIGIRQQVYDFGKTSASTDAGKSRMESARIGIDLTRTALAYQTVQAFNAILYLRAAAGVQDEQIATLQQHIEVTRRRVAAGSATDFDVLTTQVRVATAENQRIDIVNAQRKAEIALSEMMGRESAAPLLVTGVFEPAAVPSNTDSLMTRAIAQRPDMRLATNEVESAKLMERIAGVSDRPSLNLGVSYGVKNGYMPNLDVLRGNLAASLRLDVPIWEGGRAGYRQEEASASLRAAVARFEDLRSQVGMEVRQAMSDLRSAADKLAASELQVKQAREAVEIARKRYESGAISNLDLLDTETSLEQADLLHLQALYAVTTSRYSLSRAVGDEPWK